VSGNSLVNAFGQSVVLHGVNITGPQYMCLGGHNVWDSTSTGQPPTQANVDAMLSWHINAVRIPLNEACWLGIDESPDYSGAFSVDPAWAGAVYQQQIESYVNLLAQNNIAAILDLQWVGPSNWTPDYHLYPLPDADHAPAFWSSVAAAFAVTHTVLFDAFNEPAVDTELGGDNATAWACWRDGCSLPTGSAQGGYGPAYTAVGMQALVNTIRAAGAVTQPIMLGGLSYSNLLTNWLAYEPTDPANGLVASWHSYAGQSCDNTNPSYPNCWEDIVAPVAAQVPVVTGEIGENDCNHTYIDPLMDWADGQGISYLAWDWSTYDCASEPALLTDLSGNPTNYGIGYLDHLFGLAGLPTPTPPPAQLTVSITSVNVGAASVAPGDTEALSTTVNASGALSGAIVDFEVYDGNNKVYQTYQSEDLAANTPQTFGASWAVPTDQAAGSYRLKIGIFAAGWASLYAWDDTGATFEVSADTATATATDSPVPPSDTPTNTPASTQTATDTTDTPTQTDTSTDTPTNTAVPPSNTPTNTATKTNTPVPPTNTPTKTNTAIPPTSTQTSTSTPTNTPVPPTNTAANTATNTPSNTATATSTPIPPTDTATNTVVPPTDTETSTSSNTAVPPSDTPTNTSVPLTATNTPTDTPVPPTDTPSSTPTNTPTATAMPTVIAVTGKLQLSPDHGAGGSLITVTGSRFRAGEYVSLRFYCAPSDCGSGSVEIGTATADGSGGFSARVMVPLFAPQGHHGLGAMGAAGSFAWARFVVTAPPTLRVVPNSGPSGANITVLGTGFAVGEQVSVAFYCWPNNCGAGTLPLGTATTDSTGAFTLSATVPPFAPFGPHGVGGTGSSSGLFVNTVYTVTSHQAVVLTPDSGPAGSSFTIKGSGFGVDEQVPISFYCWPNNCGAGTVPLGVATSDGNGTFSLQVQVPAHAPAGPHGVGGIGQTSNRGASTPFIVSNDVAPRSNTGITLRLPFHHQY
jgi:hypothetical protein